MRSLLWVVQILIVPLLSPLGVGLVNMAKAKIQKRQGPTIFQPYRNLWKLFHKDEVISRDASYIFRIAPFIVFGVSAVVAASVPVFASFLSLPTSDLVTVVCLLALGTFFLALAGMDTGSAFGGFGSSREMTISAIAEGLFIFSILSLVLICDTTNLVAISQNIAGHYEQFLVPILLAFAGFVIVLLAETNRYPFDNPDTHLELTMIHEAMILEYSGKRLALMEWAAANKLMIFGALAANLFFPTGIAQDAGAWGVLIGLGVFIAKISVLYVALALLESSIAKLRFFRLPGLLWTAYILNAFAIGLVK